MKIGNRDFDLHNHTYVMGILNVTPDSFSDGGKYKEMDKALWHVEQMIKQGADLIDLGGESTRPGHQLISKEEEMNRVVPMIKEIKARFDIPLSLDTYKSEVALAGLETGVDMINDIWGLCKDDKMARVIAKSNKPCCLMHNRENSIYNHLITDVLNDLEKSVDIALASGIDKNNIILDPGVGFGKTYEQNIEVIGSLARFGELGYPLLLGASNKSVIGLALDLPVEERLTGTLVTSVFAVLAGFAFIRVHQIQENVRAVKMAESLLHRKEV